MFKNHWSSFTKFGKGIVMIVSLFTESNFTPSDNIRCPRKPMNFTPIWHLFLFRFSPLLRIFKNTLSKRSLCSARVLPHTIISSWDLALPGTSEIMKVITRWKTSLVEWLNSVRWCFKAITLIITIILGDLSFSHLLLFPNIARTHLLLRKSRHRTPVEKFLPRCKGEGVRVL